MISLDLVRIKKANKVMLIDRNLLTIKLNEGYDQVDEDGNVLKRATGGRTVSLPEHNKVLEELETLKNASDDNEELTKLQEDFEELKKENTALKGKNTKLENELEAMKEPKK